jgi:hypothetical protein
LRRRPRPKLGCGAEERKKERKKERKNFLHLMVISDVGMLNQFTYTHVYSKDGIGSSERAGFMCNSLV